MLSRLKVSFEAAGAVFTVRKNLPVSVVAALAVVFTEWPTLANAVVKAVMALAGAHLLVWLGILVVQLWRSSTTQRDADMKELATNLSEAVADNGGLHPRFAQKWSPHLRRAGFAYPSSSVAEEDWLSYIYGILPYLEKGEWRATKKEAKRLLRAKKSSKKKADNAETQVSSG